MNNRVPSIVIVFLVVTAGFLGFITFETDVVSAGTIYVGSGHGNHTTSVQLNTIIYGKGSV